MSSFFVTGTDTDVGKTVVSRAIMQALQKIGIQVVGYKPIAFGQEDVIYPDHQTQTPGDYDAKDNPDVLTLINSTKEKVRYEDVNSYTFLHSMPILNESCKRVKISKLNADLARLSSRYQSVLVEGAFGWLTPINKDYSFADWVYEQKMPVVLVVGIKEGCINHTLLTVQSILERGLPLLGWVANRINPGLGHYAEVIETLKQKVDAPLLGEVAYIHKPEEQDLSRFITDIDRLTYMQTELVA
ncbi:dethiobiotin synthase [Aggregatibacter kilianii]|uniref:dethiobiotin synthase n=1 Tax=Aggregatibacter kilianii TaxID=2025884 RepID=UPI000D659BA7|nr:dethiobiotin synthase [Aggregatibacter kilianii]